MSPGRHVSGGPVLLWEKPYMVIFSQNQQFD